jgi:hypothetical protein
MKKSFLTFIAFWACFSSLATIRRVNNNAGLISVSGLVYTTLIAAIDEAIAGDTLYVEPSSTSYIMASILSKRLIIIGDGYQKGSNANLTSPLSYNLNESVISGLSSLSINAGAENSIFIGLVLNNSITVNSNNILFKRCSFLSGGFSNNLSLNGSSIIVEQCFFSANGSGHGDILGSGTGNILRNCIIQDVIYSQVNLLVDQCIVGGVNNTLNSVFTNSIIGSNNHNGGTNSTFNFCIRTGGTFGSSTGNNNIENANPADIFESNSPTLDKNYRLKVASAAIGAGNAGQDIGAFGGTEPYRLSGQASIPIVRNFFLSTTGSTASGLSGSITIQSNN